MFLIIVCLYPCCHVNLDFKVDPFPTSCEPAIVNKCVTLITPPPPPPTHTHTHNCPVGLRVYLRRFTELLCETVPVYPETFEVNNCMCAHSLLWFSISPSSLRDIPQRTRVGSALCNLCCLKELFSSAQLLQI